MIDQFVGRRITKITGNEIILENGAVIDVHPRETLYATPDGR